MIQDRYSTIGLISIYLHPNSKGIELRETRHVDQNSRKNDHPVYLSGDFNQADSALPDLWNDLLIHARVTDIHPNLSTFEGPNGYSALDRILCPTEYLAAAQVDVLVATHRRHHLSGHYQNYCHLFWSVHVLKSNMKRSDPPNHSIGRLLSRAYGSRPLRCPQ